MITYPSQVTGPALWGATPYGRPAMNPTLQDIFNRLPPTYLNEVQNAALQDRFDTKYLLTEEQAATIFDRLLDRYKVLEVEGYPGRSLPHALFRYTGAGDVQCPSCRRTTPLQGAHALLRRFAHFVPRSEAQDQPQPHGEDAHPRAGGVDDWRDGRRPFLPAQVPYNPADLVPRIYNEFIRVTLVGMHHLERLTLDFTLSMGIDDIRVDLPGLVVVEVKQLKRTTQAGIFRQLHDLHLLPTSFSKYVFATAQLTNDVRKNRFKERHMHVADVMRAWDTLNLTGY